MDEIDRRDFLKLASWTVAGSLAAVACGVDQQPAPIVRKFPTNPPSVTPLRVNPEKKEEYHQIIKAEASRMGIEENTEEMANWELIASDPKSQNVRERFARVAFYMQARASKNDDFNLAIDIYHSHINSNLQLLLSSGNIILDNKVLPSAFYINLRPLSFKIFYGSAILDKSQFTPVGLALELTKYLNMVDRAETLLQQDSVNSQALFAYGCGKEAEAYIKACGIGYKDPDSKIDGGLTEQDVAKFIELGKDAESLEWQQYTTTFRSSDQFKFI